MSEHDAFHQAWNRAERERDTLRPPEEPWAIQHYASGYTGYATRHDKDGDLEEVECGHTHPYEREARECVRDQVDPGWRA